MKNTILTVFVMSALIVILLSNTMKVTSTGAPIGSTGAPGETNCARSGCHTGNNNVNTGTGIMDISIADFNGTYIPGKTYTITVTLQQENIKRFGFSLAALNTNHKSAGQLTATDLSRTQVLKGSNQFEGREYITYKIMGTNPYTEHTGKWTFDWTAPAQQEGPVSFYLAGVSANNDGTDLGDEVYTDSLVVPRSSTGIKNVKPEYPFTVYPNPVKEHFTVSFLNKAKAGTQIILTSPDGHSSYMLFDGILNKGAQTIECVKPLNLDKGVYLLHLKQNTTGLTQKLVID